MVFKDIFSSNTHTTLCEKLLGIILVSKWPFVAPFSIFDSQKARMKKKIGKYKSNISNVSNDMIKVVILGDGTVGKTCLTLTYSTNKFPTKYGNLISIVFSLKIGKFS